MRFGYGPKVEKSAFIPIPAKRDPLTREEVEEWHEFAREILKWRPG